MASDYEQVEGPQNCPDNVVLQQPKRQRMVDHQDLQHQSEVGPDGTGMPTVVLSTGVGDSLLDQLACRDVIMPALFDFIGNDPDMMSRIRHPSFQAGLRLIMQGRKHNGDCPVAAGGEYNHPRECVCLKRAPPRPGMITRRRKATILVSERDLMCYPLKQFNAFIQDSGLADSQFVEYTRYLRDMWHRPVFSKDRLPDECCELGCGHLKDFRQLLNSACLTPNGIRFLEEERERFMNRRQQHNSRQRRKVKSRDSTGSPIPPEASSPASYPTTPSRLPDPIARAIQLNSTAQQYSGNFPAFAVLPQFTPNAIGAPDIGRPQTQGLARLSAFSYQWPGQQGPYQPATPGMSMATQQFMAMHHPQIMHPDSHQTSVSDFDAARQLSSLSSRFSYPTHAQQPRLAPISPPSPSQSGQFYGPEGPQADDEHSLPPSPQEA
eukprot:m.61958 g.61958  ORF g.61958 m.61958 type:complete len:436 (+) comp7114_c0_seq1:187-1494(+)